MLPNSRSWPWRWDTNPGAGADGRSRIMISKRDIVVGVIACCATLGVVAFAQSGQSDRRLMNSAVFDWEKIAVKETKTGSTRDFFRGPTATLDQLECHVTTVKAGEASHAAHSHPE